MSLSPPIPLYAIGTQKPFVLIVICLTSDVKNFENISRGLYKFIWLNYFEPWQKFIYFSDFVWSTYLLKQLGHRCLRNPWRGGLVSCCNSGKLHRNLGQPVKRWSVLLSPPRNPSRESHRHGIHWRCFRWCSELQRNWRWVAGRGRIEVLSPLPFWWKVCKSCESKAVELICSLLSGLLADFFFE